MSRKVAPRQIWKSKKADNDFIRIDKLVPGRLSKYEVTFLNDMDDCDTTVIKTKNWITLNYTYETTLPEEPNVMFCTCD